jgi:peroxiredoxin
LPDFFYEKFIVVFWCKELKINTFATLIKILNMKKIVLLAIATLSIFACNKVSENEFVISGTAEGIENGTKVYLQVQGETEMIAKDTVEVQSGKFEIKGAFETLEIAIVTVEGNNPIPFIMENGNITIKVNKDTIQNSVVGGTPENELFQDYSGKTKEVYKKIGDFQAAKQEEFMGAQAVNDTVTMNALMNQLKTMQEELIVLAKDVISKNNDKYLSALLLENNLATQTITAEEGKAYFDKFTDKIKQTRSGKNIEKIVKAATEVVIGKPAPDFSAPSPEGKTISLKESLGKVTIIDFWASWCAPCRQENPNVVAMYNELHEKGLNIIGVSLDRDGDKWKEAIAKDGLTWPQISNLKFWQEPIAEQYNVKSIPATFILDENGIIVARDLRGDELKAKVKELLGL